MIVTTIYRIEDVKKIILNHNKGMLRFSDKTHQYEVGHTGIGEYTVDVTKKPEVNYTLMERLWMILGYAR